MSKQHRRMLQVERFFRQSRNELNMFNLFRLCWKHNIHLCQKNRSTCSIPQWFFDIVAGVDGALVRNGVSTKGRTVLTESISNSTKSITFGFVYLIDHKRVELRIDPALTRTDIVAAGVNISMNVIAFRRCSQLARVLAITTVASSGARISQPPSDDTSVVFVYAVFFRFCYGRTRSSAIAERRWDAPY